MPTGIDHVEAALAYIERAREQAGALESVGAEAVARMEAAAALLQETKERFYLKTRVGVPFARRCEGAAQALAALLTEQGAGAESDAQEQLDAALQALEKAVKTLDERSRMQGMAIT